MLIDNTEKQIEYLTKIEGKKLPPIQHRREYFIKSFNAEAMKVNSRWRAGILYGHLHIIREIKTFFNIFTVEKKGLHIGCYNLHYSFICNDYVISEYSKQKSDEFFKLLPEFNDILEKIPQIIFILKDGENTEEEMNRRINDMKIEIRSIRKGIIEKNN